MKQLSIGPLTLFGEHAGTHVHVTVLGAGAPGQRPLCGRITVTTAEWQALEATASVMLVGARTQAELAGLRVLFEEQGRALHATRATVTSQRAELEQMQPILSVIGDWDWPGIVRDGITIRDALEAAAKALAHVSIERDKAKQPRIDDESRCAVCGWPLAESVVKGCVRGNCSQRPRPDNLYAPERAAREMLAR